jgi:hypothetical protein
VKQHEADPGPAKRWEELEDHFVWNVLYPEAPDSYLENTEGDPQWKWSKEPDVREAVRPQVAELAGVATFLASEGVALNNEAYALFVDAVQDNFYPAVSLRAAPTATIPETKRRTAFLSSQSGLREAKVLAVGNCSKVT